jgi:spermidine/putrescine transport system ATP-binding protein
MLVELDSIHDEVGITFIYVTHDQAEALSVSDRIAVMDGGKILQVGSPQDIYENPKAEFVARFIGDTNLFSGKVVSFSNGISLVQDERIGAIKVEAGNEAPEGSWVSVAVRPEKIRISLAPPAEAGPLGNVVKGMVDEPIYSGFQSKYYVRTPGGGHLVVFRQHAQWSEGVPDIKWKDEVWLSWSARDAVVVEASGTSIAPVVSGDSLDE